MPRRAALGTLRGPSNFLPMSSPLVSVVVPCYNAARFVAETVQSVLGQTLRDLELIVVDDGSRDDSAVVVRRQADPRLRYVHQANAGVSAARNTGIAAAAGTYVAFLDADDTYLPGNLERKVAYLGARPAVPLVYSSEIVFDSDSGREVERTSGKGGRLLNELLEMRPGMIYSPSSVVVRRDVLERIGGFDPKLSTSADWDLWIRLAVEGEFGYIEEPLVRYRRHETQMHRNIDLMARDCEYVLEKSRAAGLYQTPAHFRRAQARVYLVIALSYLVDARDSVGFIRYFTKSLTRSSRPLRERLLGRRGGS